MTWTVNAGSPVATWNSIASSSDGAKLIACENDGRIYQSTNGGVSWTASTGAPTLGWGGVASSADGSRLVAVPGSAPNPIYTSTDGGVTWSASTYVSQTGMLSVASSADGTRMIAGEYDYSGKVLTYAPSIATSPGATGRLTGNQLSAVELIYVGNDVFRILSREGQINSY